MKRRSNGTRFDQVTSHWICDARDRRRFNVQKNTGSGHAFLDENWFMGFEVKTDM